MVLPGEVKQTRYKANGECVQRISNVFQKAFCSHESCGVCAKLLPIDVARDFIAKWYELGTEAQSFLIASMYDAPEAPDGTLELPSLPSAPSWALAKTY